MIIVEFPMTVSMRTLLSFRMERPLYRASPSASLMVSRIHPYQLTSYQSSLHFIVALSLPSLIFNIAIGEWDLPTKALGVGERAQRANSQKP